MEDFLKEQSGGDRLLAVVSALFVALGIRFNLFSNIRREKITASDTSTGMVADLECISEDDEIFFAVEVKDRKLTIHQIKEKIPNLREKNVADILFITSQEIAPEDQELFKSLAANEFVSGYNIHIFELGEFAKIILSLLKEEGRKLFLEVVGSQLDEYSDIHHRRAWAELLRAI